jgi:hypothetical protein
VRAVNQIVFLLTNEMRACYVGTKSLALDAIGRKTMTDQSQTAPNLRKPLSVEDLSPGQRSLVELMRGHQFGRIETMLIRGGEPILNSDVKVVRVARLGSGTDGARVTRTEFELKKQVRDLFEELAQLENGTVILLEFRHGLPFLLETTPTLVHGHGLQRDSPDKARR